MAKADDSPAMVKGQHNPFVNGLLAHAQTLADERADLMAQTSANRESLRSLRVQKLMSDEQAGSVEAFYPTRTKKVATPATPADPEPATVAAP